MSVTPVNNSASGAAQFLNGHPFAPGIGHVDRVGGSAGFTMKPFSLMEKSPPTRERSAAVADHAAYTAKKNGRNARVGVYGNRKGDREALTRTDSNLPVARQGVVSLRSSLEKIEEHEQKQPQEKA